MSWHDFGFELSDGWRFVGRSWKELTRSIRSAGWLRDHGKDSASSVVRNIGHSTICHSVSKKWHSKFVELSLKLCREA